MHPLRVEFTGRKNEFALNLLMCKSVPTKGKIYAKVENAESANPFTQGCKWVCKLGIYHFCANFTLSLHVSKFEGNPFFRPVIQVHGNGQRNYNMHATATGRRGCVCGGEVICLKKVHADHSYNSFL